MAILDVHGRPISLPIPARRSRRRGDLTVDGGRTVYGALGYETVRSATHDARSYNQRSGDRHIRYDREKLINQSRDALRNHEIYKGVIETAIDFIYGEGFLLQATSESKQWNADVEGLWNEWWDAPEIRNMDDGTQTGRLVLRELLTCGDNVTIKTKKGLLQVVESEQIKSQGGPQSSWRGIDLDVFGRPVRFWVSPYNTAGQVDNQKAVGYSADQVLYLIDRERPSQTRGVPPLQATFSMLHRISDLCDAEAIAAQMLARIAVSVNKEGAESQAYQLSGTDPTKTSSDDTSDDLSTRMTELNYALMFWASPGETIKGVEHNIPGKNFTESLRMFLRLLGLPVGMPLELVLLDWTGCNYSQSRAIFEQAYKRFRRWQWMMRTHFFDAVLRWKVAGWEQSGELKRRKTKAPAWQWVMPEFPWIDQLKEAQAHAMQMERGMSSHTQVVKALGADREDLMDIREREVRDAIERSQKIESETGQRVPYEMFCGLKPAAPGGFTGASRDGDRKERPDETMTPDERDDANPNDED